MINECFDREVASSAYVDKGPNVWQLYWEYTNESEVKRNILYVFRIVTIT
jgi:hypothetical protein